MGESRRKTWSVKEEGSKCVKIYEHFFLWMQRVKTTPYKEVEESGNRSTTPYKGVDVTGENYSFVRKWM